MLFFRRDSRAIRNTGVRLALVAVCCAVAAGAAGASHASTRAATPVPTGAKGKWKLIFDDEFSEKKLDTKKWYPTCPWKGQNGACSNQWDGSVSCEEPDNVSLQNGDLALTAKREAATCPGIGKAHYTGAWVDTIHDGQPTLFSFKKGFVEVRVKEPATSDPGSWVLAWSQPASDKYSPKIEMDVAEWESNLAPKMSFYYHWPCKLPVCQTYGNHILPLPKTYYSGWHTFGVNYEPGKVSWYVDGYLIHAYASKHIQSVPMDVRLTYEINGRTANPVNSKSKFPQTLLVDYVRVWKPA